MTGSCGLSFAYDSLMVDSLSSRDSSSGSISALDVAINLP